jgi:hypothetical protein
MNSRQFIPMDRRVARFPPGGFDDVRKALELWQKKISEPVGWRRRLKGAAKPALTGS